MKTVKLYLIRHGETDLNKQRILQGQSDFELNAYGRELAEKTREGLRDTEFDLVFSSPLKRAKETAEIIISGREPQPLFIEDKRIQEISFGEFEGLCCGKEHYNIPDKDFNYFFQAPEKYRVPKGGESFEEIIARTGEFLKEITGKPEYADKTVLVSTHGCALKALLANIRPTPLSRFWGEGVNKNCAVTIVEAKEGKFAVLEEGKLYY